MLLSIYRQLCIAHNAKFPYSLVLCSFRDTYIYRVIVFGGGKREVCPRYIGIWGFPPRIMLYSVPLSRHTYLSVFTGRQELSFCYYCTLFQLECSFYGGELEYLGKKLPPSTPCRLNPVVWVVVDSISLKVMKCEKSLE